MAIRVGRWDCKTCEHKGILGPETQCPNCASPRPDNVEFYLPDDAEAVQDEAQIKKAHAGADWICAHCTGHNKTWDVSCQSCGSLKEAVDGDEELKETIEFFNQRSKQAIANPAKPSFKKKGNKILRFLMWVGLAFITFIGLTFFSADIEVQVLEHKWERKIDMEQYKQVTEEAWDIPQGGQMIKSWRAIHHHDQKLLRYETKTREKQVKVGEERYVCGRINKGNGYFEDKYCTRSIYKTRTESYKDPVYEQIPVYATKYQYNIMRWKKIEPLYASKPDKQPYWPKLRGNQIGKDFRQRKKEEKYYITIKDHQGKKQKEEVDFNFWQKVPEKSKIPATKSLVFGFYKGLKPK